VVPTNWDGFQTDFFGETMNFPGLLEAALTLIRQNLETVQTDAEAATEVLHGLGFEGDGTILRAGTGLTCVVGNGPLDHFWIAGRRYAFVPAGGEVVALSPSSTAHLYMTAAGTVTPYPTKFSSTPAGTWYCGSAATDGTTCTAVDDSLADRVSSIAAVRQLVLQLVAAVGLPYANEATIAARLAILEAGGSAGEDPISWDALQKQYGVDPTTIVQQITSMIAAHVTAMHQEATDDTGKAIVEVSLTRWNSEATRNGRIALLLCRTLNPQLFEHLEDCAAIVWGVYGDGSNGTPNFVDPASTWVYVAP